MFDHLACKGKILPKNPAYFHHLEDMHPLAHLRGLHEILVLIGKVSGRFASFETFLEVRWIELINLSVKIFSVEDMEDSWILSRNIK